MYVGKPLFAQVMDFLPWKTFHRIVDRHGRDHYTTYDLRDRNHSIESQYRWFYEPEANA